MWDQGWDNEADSSTVEPVLFRGRGGGLDTRMWGKAVSSQIKSWRLLNAAGLICEVPEEKLGNEQGVAHALSSP